MSSFGGCTGYPEGFDPQARKFGAQKRTQAVLMGALNPIFDGQSSKCFAFAGKVTEISTADKLHDAFNALLDARVQSAPVFDEASGGYVGFYTTLDIAKKIITTEGKTDSEMKECCHKLRMSELEYISSKEPMVALAHDESLTAVVRLLTKDLAGSPIRRVPIVDTDTGRITKIISQSSLIKFIDTELAASPGVSAKLDSISIGDSGLIRRNPKSVTDVSSLDDAVRLMFAHNITGVPALDKDGRLIGHVAASDVCYVMRKHGVRGCAKLTVAEFIAEARAAGGGKCGCIGDTEVNLLKPSSSILSVFQSLATPPRAHRVYIVDDGVLLGVVSLKDMLKLLVV